MNEVILKCCNICKKIGNKEILKDVSFSVEKGDIFGFIGPNGAGKTTIIKLMLGLQKISSGSVYINGFDIEKDFVKGIEKVGAIVENPDFYMYLSGRKNLELKARLYKDINKERIDEVIELVGLENRIDDKVSKYSLGMRERLGIASALLNRPNLLVLDEPTNYWDIGYQIQLMDLVKSLHITTLAAIHDINLATMYCDYLIVMKAGEIVKMGLVEEVVTAPMLKNIFGVNAYVGINPINKSIQVSFMKSHEDEWMNRQDH